MKNILLFLLIVFMWSCNKNKISDYDVPYFENEGDLRVLLPVFESDNCNGRDGYTSIELNYVPSGYNIVLFYRDIYSGPCGINIIEIPECSDSDVFLGTYYPQLINPQYSGKFFVNLGVSNYSSGCTKICRQIIVGIVEPQVSDPTINDLRLAACCDFCFTVTSSSPA